jgi:hypothetical protein
VTAACVQLGSRSSKGGNLNGLLRDDAQATPAPDASPGQEYAPGQGTFLFPTPTVSFAVWFIRTICVVAALTAQ